MKKHPSFFNMADNFQYTLESPTGYIMVLLVVKYNKFKDVLIFKTFDILLCLQYPMYFPWGFW